MFVEDLTKYHDLLRERIEGRRVLALGGAGTIGAATVSTLANYRPRALHVIDVNENALAELVRDLRSGTSLLRVADFRALPLDYGSVVMRHFLQDSDPYDLVLNFAAVKHVRSEKDPYSLMQLLDTNLVKHARLLRWLKSRGGVERYFCVSTDKAANPVNVMGASKRLMEHMIFSQASPLAEGTVSTSARFANVAFSAGSLLEGFTKRLQKRQPLAVPSGVRRYFVSPQESGQICVLAAVIPPSRHILVPRLRADRDLKELSCVAADLLARLDLRAKYYDDEAAARANVSSDLGVGEYPVLLTPLDTSGEKPYEEFAGADEVLLDLGFGGLAGLQYAEPADCGAMGLVKRLESALDDESLPSKGEVLSWLHAALPEFQHKDATRNLDERM